LLVLECVDKIQVGLTLAGPPCIYSCTTTFDICHLQTDVKSSYVKQQFA